MKSKRLAFKVEPILKPVHRYIVEIRRNLKSGKVHTCWKYCVNRAEVRKIKAGQKEACTILVFKAEHDFSSGWLIE